jgi:DNA invertase Pin-like site-specific DNA recombinase
MKLNFIPKGTKIVKPDRKHLGTMICAIYARVSTVDQDCTLQLNELRAYAKRAGWEAVEYVDQASGKAGSKRPALDKLMLDAALHKFDCVAVWKLDRFGRSVQEFVGRVMTLDTLNIRFVAPTQGIDTDTRNPAGRLLMHVLAAIAEFERDLICERVKAGMAAAKFHGVKCGRPIRMFQRDEARELHKKGFTVREIAAKLGISKSTIQRHGLSHVKRRIGRRQGWRKGKDFETKATKNEKKAARAGRRAQQRGN